MREENKTPRLLPRRLKESDCDDLFEFLSKLEADAFEGYPGIPYENGGEHLRQKLYFHQDAVGAPIRKGTGVYAIPENNEANQPSVDPQLPDHI